MMLMLSRLPTPTSLQIETFYVFFLKRIFIMLTKTIGIMAEIGKSCWLFVEAVMRAC